MRGGDDFSLHESAQPGLDHARPPTPERIGTVGGSSADDGEPHRRRADSSRVAGGAQPNLPGCPAAWLNPRAITPLLPSATTRTVNAGRAWQPKPEASARD